MIEVRLDSTQVRLIKPYSSIRSSLKDSILTNVRLCVEVSVCSKVLGRLTLSNVLKTAVVVWLVLIERLICCSPSAPWQLLAPYRHTMVHKSVRPANSRPVTYA